MSKRSIDSLLSAIKYRKGPSIISQLPAKIAKAIEADIKAVIKAEQAGKPIPTTHALADFFNAEYGLAITFNMPHKWLNQVRQGKAVS